MMDKTSYLHLDYINTDPKLNKLIPPDIARRYHALPIATDGKRITIAMAYPEDIEASSVVASSVKASICLVQADSNAIDQRLDEIWPLNHAPPLRLLAWTPSGEIDPALRPHTHTLAEQLTAELEEVNLPCKDRKTIEKFVADAVNYQPDLIIIQTPIPPSMRQMLIDCAVDNLLKKLNTSILIVNHQRWPIKKILIGIRDGDCSYETAINWVLRLSRLSYTSVTILPLLPPIPLMYGPFLQHSARTLLKSDDPFGKKVRQIVKRLVAEDVESSFKIREGTAMEQLRSEIEENNIDLVVMGAEPQNNYWRWLIGETVNNLYIWLDRPLLITKN